MKNAEIIADFKKLADGKTPFFLKFIVSLAQKSDEMLSANYLLETYNKITQYKTVIKNEKVNIFAFENFDELNDELDNLVYNHENKKFVNKFLSNKYKNLLTKKSYELFALLRENNISIDLINDRLMSGIAALKDTKSFNFQLAKFTNEVVNFSNDLIIQKIEENNSETVFVDDQYLAVLVNDFAASQALGSSRWCISRTQSAFDSYKASNEHYGFSAYNHILRKYNIKNDKENRYIFLYDFSKNTHSADYLIGYTLNTQGKVLHKFDANNRVYSKNEHENLLSEIQLNYLKHLNKENDDSESIESLLSRVSSINDKVAICREIAPYKLNWLYKKINKDFSAYQNIYIYDEETFDFFAKKSNKLFSKGIDTFSFFDKMHFVNSELISKCIKKINVDKSVLHKIVSKYISMERLDNDMKPLVSVKIDFILNNFKFLIADPSIVRALVLDKHGIVSVNAFLNSDVMLSDDSYLCSIFKGISFYSYYLEGSLNSLTKLLKFEDHMSNGTKKFIKKELEKVSIIKSIINKKDLKFYSSLIPYLNLSKCINVLSEVFVSDQISFLKENRNPHGVRYYNYNRDFFEMLMANWAKANIHRYKLSNSENVLTLLLNHNDSENYKEILEWAFSKRKEALNLKVFSHNHIYGKAVANKEVVKFLEYDKDLLLPNINQISFLSLCNKKEKVNKINALKSSEIFDKSTLHNAFNKVVEINGDKELLEIFSDVFEIDCREPIVIFEEMLTNPEKYSEKDMLDFIETYNVELRSFLRKNANPFLKYLSRYL